MHAAAPNGARPGERIAVVDAGTLDLLAAPRLAAASPPSRASSTRGPQLLWRALRRLG
ncbi:hypothetical protein [Streptomyces sp. NPDC093089]|uniref:hypothetical protein n=1 Tax=Streptomyces sp. NPDC093089 TaxID=3366024 RepID=UPI003820FB90